MTVLLFKVTGLILIFLVSLGVGFLKSEILKQRCVKLSAALRGIGRLSELIKMGSYEIDELSALCFEEDFITAHSGEFQINSSSLLKEDTAVLEEFLQGFGILEPEAEYKRAKAYYTLLEEQYKKAQKNYDELGRLYRSVGAMAGLILCIFLM